MTDFNIAALLQGETTCWKCSATIPVTALWVPGFIDNEDRNTRKRAGLRC
ncbi:hypothetical protein [Xanthomonas campestris]